MEVPRVTEILRAYTSYDQVPKDILEKAAARGTTVHALCAGLAKGNWIPDGMIGEEHIGYVNSFKKWSEAQVKKFMIIEKRYTDDDLSYSGQLDFVIVGSDDQLYLVDLKTSSRPQKTYPVQMAAYNSLLKNNQVNVKGAMLVYLDKNGEFPEIHYMEDMSEEFRVFISALQCWHYFNKRKQKNGTIDSTAD
jgi:PD-(D/E)XK nuclease superfamily protein